MIKLPLNTLLAPFRLLKRLRTRSALPTEVSALLPVLELLAKQVTSVAEKGNQSTEELSRSFGEMAESANELVSQVTSGPRDDSGIENIQQVLRLLLSKFQESNKATSATGETLSLIEQELKQVEVCASEVEEISRRARLVSFNGRIEAERAGAQGEGFAVVAEETGKLALTVAKTSKEIGDAVGRLSATLRQTSQEMQSLVSHGSSAAEECERNVIDTLNELQVYQSQLEENLDRAKATGDSLAGSISRSIVGLQFQDAVSQRMHHVSDSLEEIKGHFSEIVPSTPRSSGRSKAWLDQITSTYCVEEEHLVYTGAQSEPQTSNVELF